LLVTCAQFDMFMATSTGCQVVLLAMVPMVSTYPSLLPMTVLSQPINNITTNKLITLVAIVRLHVGGR